MNGTEVLEIKKETAEQKYIYSAKEIWELSSSSSRSWDRFVAEFLFAIGGDQKKDYLEEHPSRNGGNRYTEKTLKAFQAWLMKNQTNQGKSSEVVKQATTQAVEKDLVITEVIKSGNQEAFDQLMKQYKLAFDTAQENKRLLEQTKQMEHALEYDEVVGWKKWSELKKELAQNFELLRHKISYTKLFDEVGLVENEDYKRKVMGFDKFPTVLISPEAEDMLWDWLDGHH